MKKLNIFFCSFFVALISTFIFFFLLVNFCGRGVTDQPWLLDLYPLKTHMAKKQKSPKIIIIGGSSSLFGINGKMLKEYTGMDNINLSMSVMVPMRFYLLDLEKYVQKDDIVVLPLELTNQYCNTTENNFSQFGISLLFGCIPKTQKTLSFKELCSLYFQYGFSWINTSLFHKDGTLIRLFKMQYDKQGIFDGVYKEQYVYEKWAKMQIKDKKGSLGFYSDLSEYGDWMIDQDATETVQRPFSLPASVTDEFLFCYNRIRTLTEKRHATLLLVWTNEYFYAEQAGYSDFKNLLKSKGITIHGRPEAIAFPKKFYHEPIHHMNQYGAQLWTWELAKTISQETGYPLKKNNHTWPYIVFSENPAYYFPQVKSLQLYDTGVRIEEKEFFIFFDIPENLRGKNLDINLITLPERKDVAVFSGIQIDGKFCKIEEQIYQERMEAIIHVPKEYTACENLTLNCTINGKTIGMERLFISENKPPFSFLQGFSVAEEWGRWTDGTHAEFFIHLPEQYRMREITLAMNILTFIHEKKPICKFKILAENGDILYQMESKQFSASIKFKIPAELTENLHVKLLIDIENPVSSKELGISEDPRKLGIGIKNITIQEFSN